MKQPLRLNLTPAEKLLCDYLLSQNEKHRLGLTIRFAGGWVRDKLLGRESDDIDVTLDLMTGLQFCDAIGLNAAVVAAKPDQSKHLETAMVTLFNREVEITNLRDESWAGAYDDTRILTENRFGTPKSDAERRDLTVNALLYNLHTGEVEDYVGGLADLGFDENGQRVGDEIDLRTPLDPLVTFMDDPLRMLRAVLFRGRLPGARLDEALLDSLRSPETHRAFIDKISPERIAIVLVGKKKKDGSYKQGVVGSHDSTEAIKFLYYSGLLDLILEVPQTVRFRHFASDQNSSFHALSVLHHSLVLMERMRDHPYFAGLTPHRQHLLLFAAMLHDKGKCDPTTTQLLDVDGRCKCSYRKHETSSAVAARSICNKLKLSDEDTTYVVRVVEAHMQPHSHGWGANSCLLRFIQKYPDEWQDIIFHAHCDNEASGVERLHKVDYMGFITRGVAAKTMADEHAELHKPVIDGMLIVERFPELTQGPWIKWVVTQLNELRLETPTLRQDDYLKAVDELRPVVLNMKEFARFHRNA